MNALDSSNRTTSYPCQPPELLSMLPTTDRDASRTATNTWNNLFNYFAKGVAIEVKQKAFSLSNEGRTETRDREKFEISINQLPLSKLGQLIPRTIWSTHDLVNFEYKSEYGSRTMNRK